MHTPKETVLKFINAVNSHNAEEIILLMTEDHIFIDAYGNMENKEQMKRGWPGYFEWFPDYSIEVSDVFEKGNEIVILGYAGGTYKGARTSDKANSWRVPAAWRAVEENGKVKIWQVFADSKVPFDIINKK